MFINFELLINSEMALRDFMFLNAIKQKDEKAIKLFYNEDIINSWIEKKIIKRLKKGELRIDTKGELFLKNMSSSLAITEDTEKIIEWLVKVYKSKPNGIVKNKTETKRRCQWWTDQTGIEKNKLGVLLKCFLEDSFNTEEGTSIEKQKRENPRLVLSNLMDNIFWNPPNNFARHYTIDNSPLWTYYEDNMEYIKNQWKKYGITE